jgi:hypothetical protein
VATTVAVADGKTTLTIKYAAQSVLMNDVLAGIAEGLYETRGAWNTETQPATFAELTLAQKLALIDTYVRWNLIEVHRQRLLRLAQKDYELATKAAYEAGTVVIE